MKTVKRLLFVLAGICLLAACSKSDDFWGDQPLGNTLKNGSAKPVMVTVPIKFDFTVRNFSDYSDTRCGDYPNFYLTMKGEGNISHLGEITTIMTFCCNISTGVYGPAEVVFYAANGDELYLVIPIGYIIKNEDYKTDYYQTRFNDPFIITGGTGRFAGASGQGMTNAFVHHDPINWHTDFLGGGTLTFKPGKQ